MILNILQPMPYFPVVVQCLKNLFWIVEAQVTFDCYALALFARYSAINLRFVRHALYHVSFLLVMQCRVFHLI